MKNNNIPILFVMVGIPGSGKSHIADDIAKENNAVIHSMDALREKLCGRVEDQSRNKEVFTIWVREIKESLEEGKNVVADATNVRGRKKLLDLFSDIPHQTIAHVAYKEIEDCIIDNLDRPHPVPPSIIKNMAEKFTLSTKGEGFDDIIIHRYTREFDKEYDDC